MACTVRFRSAQTGEDITSYDCSLESENEGLDQLLDLLVGKKRELGQSPQSRSTGEVAISRRIRTPDEEWPQRFMLACGASSRRSRGSSIVIPLRVELVTGRFYLVPRCLLR